jgi:hypothetical protein
VLLRSARATFVKLRSEGLVGPLRTSAEQPHQYYHYRIAITGGMEGWPTRTTEGGHAPARTAKSRGARELLGQSDQRFQLGPRRPPVDRMGGQFDTLLEVAGPTPDHEGRRRVH